MNNFNVSKNFTFFELTKSKDHPHLVIANREHFSREPFLGRLCQSAEYLLESIREEINIPIYSNGSAPIPLIVLSGGRSPELNSAVKGAETSQHLFARMNDGAYDFYCPAMTIEKLGWIIQNQVDITWHQLRIYKSQGFIHIGMPLGKKDGQVTVIE